MTKRLTRDRRPSDWRGAAPEVGRSDEGQPGVEVRDPQLANPDGRPVGRLIEGVRIRDARTIPDHRGSVCVMYDPRWGFTEEPLVYTYLVTLRPGAVKGWVRHSTYDDRLFLVEGAVRWVLYDERDRSPTAGLLNELFFGDHNRALLRVPRDVWHAVENVGSGEAVMVNHPTSPYEYESPDKSRLPLDTSRIPYSFG